MKKIKLTLCALTTLTLLLTASPALAVETSETKEKSQTVETSTGVSQESDTTDLTSSIEESQSSTSSQSSEKETTSESKNSDSSSTSSETQTSESKSAEDAAKEAAAKEAAEKAAAANITYVRTYTTEQFVALIGEDARKIAGENDLYASVMIAQAILESASGSSSLAREPNYNLFGIKGSFNGQSVSMSTQEDKGNGEMYTIISAFRKYNAYSESMQDYADLLKKNSLYEGAWKANAKTYQDATNHLKGRYATDSVYNVKLNKLIETYDLTKYDHERKTVTECTYVIGENDSLPELAQRYSTTVEAICEDNQLNNNFISVGQELRIRFGKDHKVVYEDELDNQKGLRVYLVGEEESLQSIADKYQTSVVKLLECNTLESIFLKAGQRIYIPEN